MSATLLSALPAETRLRFLECEKCASSKPGIEREPCVNCVTGRMVARIRELESGFNYDWSMNRWHGKCGHSWQATGSGVGEDESCPFCDLKRVAERLATIF